MNRVFFLALAAVCLAGSATAADPRALSMLKKLDPAERLEQRCDMEAMDRIGREGKGFRPDKVIAYTFAETAISGDAIRAPGAVFRSRGEWYRLKYRCETGPAHLKVRSFDYRIGAQVPRADWERYYLYD